MVEGQATEVRGNRHNYLPIVELLQRLVAAHGQLVGDRHKEAGVRLFHKIGTVHLEAPGYT